MKIKPISTSDWSIVVPYYNEEVYLLQCLSCIVRQTSAPRTVILVNNGSTDRSPDIVYYFKKIYKDYLDIILVDEEIPGKIYAMRAGIKHVNTKRFAIWDADAFYPSNYLETADKFYQKNVVAVMAADVRHDMLTMSDRIRMVKLFILSRIFTSECHAGGYAETFDTEAYHKVGGFDPDLWPYVLEDHEIVQRLLGEGEVVYPPGLWCCPSPRRHDRSRVTWTSLEKRLYRFLPYKLKDWYFYSFLGPRFKERGLLNTRLREQAWQWKKR
ncbi:glycosyltransferase [Saccharibacter sp. 17.LH.SD]|uniref:glycosyltransferase family 2 protein n=1 Tax=Saccharibacter sp. 17.LH.SD TaxID=2689393 RepID=UPI00136D6EC1|nr:glycosyltransferase family A protein [Saccharibacter sp. 17.LH.SD]MXV45210.1 glycosyltransferase [Saccharibacter sp. 17.LH.SD]